MKRHFSYGPESLHESFYQVYLDLVELSVAFNVVVFTPASKRILPKVELDDYYRNPYIARAPVVDGAIFRII